MRENGPGRFRAVFLAFLHLSCRRSHALEQLGMGTLVASSAKGTTSIPPKPALSGVVYDPGRPSAQRSHGLDPPWRPTRHPYTMTPETAI